MRSQPVRTSFTLIFLTFAFLPSFAQAEKPADPSAHEPPVTAKDRAHWAFQSPIRPPVPAVRQGRWIRTPVDTFILAALEKAGLAPAPPADRATLLRRLQFGVQAPIADGRADLRFLDNVYQFFFTQQGHSRDHDKSSFGNCTPAHGHHSVVGAAQQHAVAGNEPHILCHDVRHLIDLLELSFAQEAAELAASDAWEEDGSVSAIDWLRFNCKMTTGAAANSIAVGEAMNRIPASGGA